MEEEYPISKKRKGILVFKIVMIQKKVGCMLEIWVWEVKGTLFCGKETLLQVHATFTEKKIWGPTELSTRIIPTELRNEVTDKESS